MDKITKNYLKNLIESIQGDMEEMALRQKGTRDDIKPSGEFAPIWFPSNSTPPGEYGEPDGFYLPSINQVVISLDCQELGQFTESNKEWLEGLAEKYHNKYNTSTDEVVKEILYAPCRKTAYASKELKTFLSSKGWIEPEKEEKKVDVEELNKRTIGELIRENLFGSGVSDVFRKKTIPHLPMIKGTMQTLWQGLRGYGDQYKSDFSNNKIAFKLFAGSQFLNKIDFLETVINNDSNDFESTSAKNYYVSRQFNDKYPNYDAGRKMSKKFEGLTPKQKKQVRDFEEANINATIRTDFDILGEFIGDNSFRWKIDMSVSLGDKLEEDERLKKPLMPLNNISVTKNVQIRPNVRENTDFVLMKNPEIKEGFIGVCDELKQRIEAISFEELLTYANTSVEGGLDDFGLQESVQKLVDKIVKELTK
jgi:hypothetical protein